MDVREQIVRAIMGDSDTLVVDTEVDGDFPVDNGFDDDSEED